MISASSVLQTFRPGCCLHSCGRASLPASSARTCIHRRQPLHLLFQELLHLQSRDPRRGCVHLTAPFWHEGASTGFQGARWTHTHTHSILTQNNIGPIALARIKAWRNSKQDRTNRLSKLGTEVTLTSPSKSIGLYKELKRLRGRPSLPSRNFT